MVDTTVYLGPYLEVPRLKQTVMEDVQGCVKCKRPNPTSEKFCGKCGGEIGNIKQPVEDYVVDEFEFVESIKEKLCFCGIANRMTPRGILLPNVRFGIRNPFIQTETDQVLALEADLPAHETGAFRSFFNEEIAAAVKAFGKADLKWGLVVYNH